MKIQIENGSASVRTSQHTPQCLDISVHISSRETLIQAKPLPQGPGDHAVVVLRIEPKELQFEKSDDTSLVQNAAELAVFMTREQVEEMVKTLQESLGE